MPYSPDDFWGAVGGEPDEFQEEQFTADDFLKKLRAQEEPPAQDKPDDFLKMVGGQSKEPVEKRTEFIEHERGPLPHETPEQHAARIQRVEDRPKDLGIYKDEEELEDWIGTGAARQAIKDTVELVGAGARAGIGGTLKTGAGLARRIGGKTLPFGDEFWEYKPTEEQLKLLPEKMVPWAREQKKSFEKVPFGAARERGKLEALGERLQAEAQKTLEESAAPGITKSFFAGVGHLGTQLPLYGLFAGAFGPVKGFGLLGALEGMSEADLKKTITGTLGGMAMGKMPQLMKKIKPLYARTLANAGGFASLQAAERAISEGELKLDHETMSSGLLGGIFSLWHGRKAPQINKFREALKIPLEQRTPEMLESVSRASKRTLKEYLNEHLGNIDVDRLISRSDAVKMQEQIRGMAKAKKIKPHVLDAAIYYYGEIPKYKKNIQRVLPQMGIIDLKAVNIAREMHANPSKYAGEIEMAGKVRKIYDAYGDLAKGEGILDILKVDYQPKLFDFGRKTKMKPYMTAKLDSVFDGMERGLRPKIRSASNLLNEYRDIISGMVIRRGFVRQAKDILMPDGKPLLSTKPIEGHKLLRTRALGKEIYAPEELAGILDRVYGVEPKSGALSTINATLKAVRLTTSFFHHGAFLRSYWMAISGHKPGELRPIKAMRSGLESLKNLDPELVQLTRHGLTTGLQQEYSEFSKSRLGRYEEFLDRVPGLRILGPKFLFGKMGAGLKAKAALIELRYANRVKSKELAKGKEHPFGSDVKMYEDVANLINNDFGGLHLQRLARDPSFQKKFRQIFLAPDWTESNLRTVTKLWRDSSRAYKMGTFTSTSKGEQALYRHFWTSVAMKGVTATLAANLITSMMSSENPTEWVKKNIDEKKIKNLLGVNITPLAEWIGGESKYSKGKKVYLSLMGHLLDPASWIYDTIFDGPLNVPKRKMSPIAGTILRFVTGSDWRFRPYKPTKELFAKGILESLTESKVKWGPSQGPKWDIIPSFILSEIENAMPVQLQKLWKLYTGELSATESIGESMGLDISMGERR